MDSMSISLRVRAMGSIFFSGQDNKLYHGDGMNKGASSEAVCSKELKSGADRLQAVLVQ
jgi:hypothetical protein